MENSLEKTKNKNVNKKINFIQKKENTICSLFEVEHFLHDFQKFINAIKIYHILK